MITDCAAVNLREETEGFGRLIYLRESEPQLQKMRWLTGR